MSSRLILTAALSGALGLGLGMNFNCSSSKPDYTKCRDDISNILI